MQYNLEDRLVDFVIRINNMAEKLPKTYLGTYIANQIIRSGTSPALNYGEAQAAESTADFIHKLKICLKELREAKISLKIIKRKPLTNELDLVDGLLDENNQLISIFVKSIEKAKRNMNKK